MLAQRLISCRLDRLSMSHESMQGGARTTARAQDYKIMVERLCNCLVFVRGADDEAVFIPKHGGGAGARHRGSSCGPS